MHNQQLGALQDQRAFQRKPLVDTSRFLSSQYVAGSSLAFDEGYTQVGPSRLGGCLCFHDSTPSALPLTAALMPG